MSAQRKKIDYVPEASKTGTHYNLCFNFNQMEFHQDEAAQFYCLREKAFLCEVCFEAHRSHVGQADSIKNHLANIFNDWRQLMERA
jgi:hypothetical protein|tara:strand:+ start:95 stop:352 length:258 start_codon:yes stop_codon:yes gene_type:complete